jgi:DNA-binding MarR family transcriptional regulator
MSEARWEAVLDRVFELTLLLGRDMAESLARDGLTESRAHVVWELHHRGPCTQRMLADVLNVTPRTITALVDGLESTGFVAREPHPTDRRATLVTLTPRGRASGRTMVAGKRRLARALFSDVAPEVLDGLDLGLREVLERLRSVLAAPTSPHTQRASHPGHKRTRRSSRITP